MKKTLSILLIIAFCTVLSGTAQGEEPKTKPKACEYKGTVKGKMENPDRITVDTQGVLKEFFFNRDKKKDCSSWQDLAIGDSVSITCKETKKGTEAKCVTSIPKGNITGVTIEGATIK